MKNLTLFSSVLLATSLLALSSCSNGTSKTAKNQTGAGDDLNTTLSEEIIRMQGSKWAGSAVLEIGSLQGSAKKRQPLMRVNVCIPKDQNYEGRFRVPVSDLLNFRIDSSGKTNGPITYDTNTESTKGYFLSFDYKANSEMKNLDQYITRGDFSFDYSFGLQTDFGDIKIAGASYKGLEYKTLKNPLNGKTLYFALAKLNFVETKDSISNLYGCTESVNMPENVVIETAASQLKCSLSYQADLVNNGQVPKNANACQDTMLFKTPVNFIETAATR